MNLTEIGISTIKYSAACMAIAIILGLAADASSFEAYYVAFDIFMIISIVLFLFNMLLLVVYAIWDEEPESFKEFVLRIIKLIVYPTIAAIIVLAIVVLLTAIAP